MTERWRVNFHQEAADPTLKYIGLLRRVLCAGFCFEAKIRSSIPTQNILFWFALLW